MMPREEDPRLSCTAWEIITFVSRLSIGSRGTSYLCTQVDGGTSTEAAVGWLAQMEVSVSCEGYYCSRLSGRNEAIYRAKTGSPNKTLNCD